MVFLPTFALLQSKLVERPGTGSLPSTIAPSDHTRKDTITIYFLLFYCKTGLVIEILWAVKYRVIYQFSDM